jgi:DNA-directed RNA polymerase subunit RPC12/RpoP
MFVAFHYPFFGSSTVDAQQMRCPQCGANDWRDRDTTTCNPGDEFECAKCGKKVYINWGLVEPDHLSGWISSEYCPHRLCRTKYAQLREERGWNKPCA